MNSAAGSLPGACVRGSTLSRAEVRELARRYGRHKLLASSRFDWLLPLVARHRIYHEDGCVSLYEWAAKFAGMGGAGGHVRRGGQQRGGRPEPHDRTRGRQPRRGT